MAIPKTDQKYTYSDYLGWPKDERWELIRGVAYSMSPAPNTEHQRILMKLSAEFYLFLKGKPCEVFPAPFDVRLLKDKGKVNDDSIDTVVQPDISVVCDASKIDKKGCIGAPDLVVEILSESTAGKDQGEKLELYEKHGVSEYWVVDPWSKILVVHINANRVFERPTSYTLGHVVEVKTIPGMRVDLNELFGKVYSP
jgi:Uma2 family endonuclease